MSGTGVSPADVTVECYVRPSAAHEVVERHLEVLRSSKASGVIGDLVVDRWPCSVVVEDRGAQDVLDAFGRFREWAEIQGVSIQPPFRVRTATSLVEDGVWHELVTPAFCVALVHGGRLLGVYPHSTGGETHTVAEAITALGAGTLPSVPLIEEETSPDASAPARERAGGRE